MINVAGSLPTDVLISVWTSDNCPAPEDAAGEPTSNRSARVDQRLNTVDWTDPGQVARVLRVFEVALRPMFSPAEGYTYGVEVTIPRIRRLLERDGY